MTYFASLSCAASNGKLILKWLTAVRVTLLYIFIKEQWFRVNEIKSSQLNIRDTDLAVK